MNNFLGKKRFYLLPLTILIIFIFYFHIKDNRLTFAKELYNQMEKVENYSYIKYKLQKELEDLEDINIKHIDIWQFINQINLEKNDSYKLENIDLLLDKEECVKISIDLQIYNTEDFAEFLKEILEKYKNFNVDSIIYRRDSFISVAKLTMVVEFYE